MCQEPSVTSAATRVDGRYKTFECVRQISKRTQADRASVEANQPASMSLEAGDERDGVVSNRLEAWKNKIL